MNQRFAFGPRNYRIMFAGLAVLTVGFITMTLDRTDYGEGFLGITLGPILLVIGFVIEFWAIMAKPGDSADTTSSTPAATPTAVATPTTPPAPATPPARPAYTKPRA